LPPNSLSSQHEEAAAKAKIAAGQKEVEPRKGHVKEKKRKEAEEKKKKAPAAAAAKAAAAGKASEKLGKAAGANIKPARISAPGKQSAR